MSQVMWITMEISAYFAKKTRYHDAVNATSYTTLLWKGSHKSAKKLGIKHAVNGANDLIFVWKFQQKSPKKLGTNMFWVSQVTWITMEISTYFAKKARYDDCCHLSCSAEENHHRSGPSFLLTFGVPNSHIDPGSITAVSAVVNGPGWLCYAAVGQAPWQNTPRNWKPTGM